MVWIRPKPGYECDIQSEGKVQAEDKRVILDIIKITKFLGSSLAIQWLGLCASTARGLGSIPGWGTKIPKAVRHSQKKKKKITKF